MNINSDVVESSGSVSFKRNRSIDGLRSSAVILVFWGHTAGDFGWIGVPLFFVLSGYLIGGRLLESSDRGDRWTVGLKIFYARRALRILPAYYGYLALITLASLAINYRPVLDQVIYAWTFTYNFHHMLAGFNWSSFLSHLWTLSVEEQFYLLFPFVVFGLGRRRLFPVLVLLMVLGPLVRWGFAQLIVDRWPDTFMAKPIAVYVAGFTHVDAFAFGAALNLLPKVVIARLGRPIVLLALVVGAAVAARLATGTHEGMMFHIFLGEAGWHFVWGYTVLSVSACSAICLALRRPENMFGTLSAPFAFVGECSYGFYLLHLPIIELTDKAKQHFGLPGPIEPYFVGSFALTLILARLSYDFYEKPFLRLKVAGRESSSKARPLKSEI